jgi:AcrR family transcriptional regulator
MTERSAYDALCDAALEMLTSAPKDELRFGDICKRAGVAKGTGYNHFVRGTDSVLEALHLRAARDIAEAMTQAVSKLPDEIMFDEVVRAAVKAGIECCAQTCFVKALRSDRDLVTSYLLSRAESSVISILGRFAARCGAAFSSPSASKATLSNSEISSAAQEFVWGILVDLLAFLPAGASGDWPRWDDETTGPMLEARISTFAGRLGCKGSRPSLAIPTVEVPRSGGSDRLQLVHLG